MQKPKIKEHEEYTIFTQLSMFEPPIKPPRNSWEYYGISKNRYKTLTKYIQSGKYDFIAVQAAKLANEMIAEYILLSIKKDLSYDVLQRLWDLEKIKRMPCGRSDFYGWRRYFYSIMDKEFRRMGK